MPVLYLTGLLVALTGMVLLDRRFRLFFWADARRAAIVLVTGVVFFVVWDLCGIGLGIFFRGETAIMTGIQVAPELPLEELFFLALLVYVTMNLYGALSRLSRPSTAGNSGLSRPSAAGNSGLSRPSTAVSKPPAAATDPEGD